MPDSKPRLDGAITAGREGETAAADTTPERDAYVKRVLEEIGTTATSLRKVRGMSQEEVGRIAGVVQGQISKVENARGGVRFATLAGIAFALRVPLPVLFTSPALELTSAEEKEPSATESPKS